MQSVKEMAHELIEHLPDTATFDDLMYEIYVRQRIEAGLKDAADGRVLSHEQAVRELLAQQPLKPVLHQDAT
jgi:predicted transcriptional regulator